MKFDLSKLFGQGSDGAEQPSAPSVITDGKIQKNSDSPSASAGTESDEKFLAVLGEISNGMNAMNSRIEKIEAKSNQTFEAVESATSQSAIQNDRSAKWANELVKAETIAPAQSDVFAQMHRKLGVLCANAKSDENLSQMVSVSYEDAEGEPQSLSLQEVFALCVDGSQRESYSNGDLFSVESPKGFTKNLTTNLSGAEVKRAAQKTQAKNNLGAKKSGGISPSGDEINILSDKEIERISQGKRRPIGDTAGDDE